MNNNLRVCFSTASATATVQQNECHFIVSHPDLFLSRSQGWQAVTTASFCRKTAAPLVPTRAPARPAHHSLVDVSDFGLVLAVGGQLDLLVAARAEAARVRLLQMVRQPVGELAADLADAPVVPASLGPGASRPCQPPALCEGREGTVRAHTGVFKQTTTLRSTHAADIAVILSDNGQHTTNRHLYHRPEPRPR